jgi:hypothetical protein
MKKLISLILAISIAGCATCKSSDTMEQCRTKQRDKSQRFSVLPPSSVLDNSRISAYRG